MIITSYLSGDEVDLFRYVISCESCEPHTLKAGDNVAKLHTTVTVPTSNDLS